MIAAAGDRAGIDQRRRDEIAIAEWSEALARPSLSREDEHRLSSIGAGLGAPRDLLADRLDLMERAIVARANDGRFPGPVVNPKVPTWRQGETVHLETAAAVGERQEVRSLQGPAWGVSVPIGLGLLYTVHLGGGRDQPAGTRGIVVDRGAVSVTDQRVVYWGSNRAFETSYDELVEMRREPYSLVLLSTRYREPFTMIVAVPDTVAAVVNLQASIARGVVLGR